MEYDMKSSYGRRNNDMQKVELQQKFHEIINVLPETKLNEIIDFARFLLNQEESEEFLRIQLSSNA